MHCVAHFDNSADNYANPDPTKEVAWGEQTWEEMMFGWFEMALADQDLTQPATASAAARQGVPGAGRHDQARRPVEGHGPQGAARRQDVRAVRLAVVRVGAAVGSRLRHRRRQRQAAAEDAARAARPEDLAHAAARRSSRPRASRWPTTPWATRSWSTRRWPAPTARS